MFSIIHPAEMKPLEVSCREPLRTLSGEGAGHLRPTENYGHFFFFSTSVIMAKGWAIEPRMGFHHPYSWVVFHRECDPPRETEIFLWTAAASALTSPLLDASRDTDLRHITQNTKESIGRLSAADMDHGWQNPFTWNDTFICIFNQEARAESFGFVPLFFFFFVFVPNKHMKTNYQNWRC